MGQQPDGEVSRDYAMVSVLGRIGYSFDDRYFLVGSIRRDASSKLPSAKNYDWFPSVSGSWKISSEKFFRNSPLAKVFDLVKLRAGWGKVGNVTLYSLPNPHRNPAAHLPERLAHRRQHRLWNLPGDDRQHRRHVGDHRADQRRSRPANVREQTRNQRRLLLQGRRAT